MECFRLLFGHLACIEHQFLSGIRDSRKARSLWGMMSGMGWVKKSMHQRWLAKGLEFGLLCWGFKGVQEEIPLGRGQHSSNRVSGISTRTVHQFTTPSLSQTIWPRWASVAYIYILDTYRRNDNRRKNKGRSKENAGTKDAWRLLYNYIYLSLYL